MFDACGFHIQIDSETYFLTQPSLLKSLGKVYLLENLTQYSKSLALGVPAKEITERLLSHFTTYQKELKPRYEKARIRAEQQVHHIRLWKEALGFAITPQGRRTDGLPDLPPKVSEGTSIGSESTEGSDSESDHSNSESPAPIP